jgi:hypothetical protein
MERRARVGGREDTCAPELERWRHRR